MEVLQSLLTVMSAKIIILILFYRFNLGGYDCHHCFQLLGVDVILDENLHPIVIEVRFIVSSLMNQ